ncbi:hypothetical protein AMATHDRAFT_46476 [Amanita thiersii Skay4041]|uniref:Protein prenylyltransferase n=1 Tax=Amanita thiersii Skay4041 TaxID=703135 RepID=A0A2A9NWH2_9AGAR|nr:hypothetical protein AMATHDRAFT_46476 [Amanita thiersii Skay4041]
MSKSASPDSPPFVTVFNLSNALARPPLSAEIIPGGSEDWKSEDGSTLSPDFPFVLIDGNLGVPKKVLYKLYLVAVTMFTRVNIKQFDLIIASTSIILLANPAHQTALNARKRLILQGNLHPEKELEFTQLLIRASDECAKQSIIWHHRQWVFLQLYGAIQLVSDICKTLQPLNGWFGLLELDTLPDVPAGVVQNELSLIRCACEIYPRNYHGWNHWRFMMNIVYVSQCLGKHGEWMDVMQREYEEVENWVEGHVSDYTSMHHLYGLVERFGLSKPRVKERALELRARYGAHEAVEKYVRLLGGG